ncbi:hypothetical protein E2C01_019307 [Portunus trituberculatus]|uniref:Uncharacterized protein n=1 Tax=Portunus trituberculatus TaxID=210409 RepID=A0A5B7DZ23_PORTR|nr:hypothetical protein [Portunus trituberculatus]
MDLGHTKLHFTLKTQTFSPVGRHKADQVVANFKEYEDYNTVKKTMTLPLDHQLLPWAALQTGFVPLQLQFPSPDAVPYCAPQYRLSHLQVEGCDYLKKENWL